MQSKCSSIEGKKRGGRGTGAVVLAHSHAVLPEEFRLHGELERRLEVEEKARSRRVEGGGERIEEEKREEEGV